MKSIKKWSSHLPILINLINITNGPVLELGAGLYSTPFLHWACRDRYLESYENDKNYFNIINEFSDENHKIYFVENWDNIDIIKYWEIVFIDLSPATKRKDMAKKLAKLAKYIILHDTEKKHDNEYKYDEIYSLFKYRYDYTKTNPNTTVLSNYIDVSKLNF